MADPLLEALAQQKQYFNQNNFWGQAGDSLGAVSTAYGQNQDEGSNPNSNLVGALLTGIGSGFMKGYGQQEVRRQTADFANVLRGVAKDYYSGGDLSSVYNSPYQALQDAAPALEFGRAANQYEQAQKLKYEKQKSALDFLNKQREQGIIPLQTQDPNGNSVLSGWTTDNDYLDAIGQANRQKQLAQNKITPELAPAAAKAVLGQDLTPDEAQQLLTGGNLNVLQLAQQAKNSQAIQERFNRGLDQKKATKNLFGYDFLTDNQLTDTESAKLRDKIAQTNVLTGVFSQLASNPNYNPDEVFGNNAALTDALKAAAFQKLRMGAGTGANSGAALSPGEKAIIEDMNFTTMATDPIGSMKRMMMGRDQKQFAKDMASVIQKLQDEEILSYGGVRSGVKPDYYNPDAINKYKNDSSLNDFGRNWFLNAPAQAQNFQQQQPVTVPQGMKAQVNPKTGQVRFVPK